MVTRLLIIVAWTVPAMLIQSVLLLLPGRGKERFALQYWRVVGFVLGLRLTVLGSPAAGRPALYIANHCSWIDIVALGSVLPGCFVAKGGCRTLRPFACKTAPSTSSHRPARARRGGGQSRQRAA